MNPDASLGITTGFDPAGFRNAIKFAMQMGAPNMDGRQIAFVKKNNTVTYHLGSELLTTGDPRLKVDRDGKPLNPNIRVTKGQDTVVDGIDCAIEIKQVQRDELPVGNFRPIRATVTVLDVDYAEIKDCRELLYNGDRYQYGFEPEDYGLFEVDVHSIVFYALEDS